MPAGRQFDVSRAGNLFGNLFVERGRRGLIEFAAHHQGRHLQMMQQGHEIGFLQNLAGGLKGLWIDPKQDFLALFDFFRMRRKISGRENALRRDLGDAAEAAIARAVLTRLD